MECSRQSTRPSCTSPSCRVHTWWGRGGGVRDVDMERVREVYNRGRKGRRGGLDGTVRINKGEEIRRDDDEFGRKMTEWRRSKTDNDTKPFPTVER